MNKAAEQGYIRQDPSIEAAIIFLRMYQNIFRQPEIMKNEKKDLLKEFCDLMLYGLAGQPVADITE